MKKYFSTLAFLIMSLFSCTASALQANNLENKSLGLNHSQLEYTLATSSGGYGEISATTGRPKTVHVKGYYRKDGTYVQPHYRSPPKRK